MGKINRTRVWCSPEFVKGLYHEKTKQPKKSMIQITEQIGLALQENSNTVFRRKKNNERNRPFWGKI